MSISVTSERPIPLSHVPRLACIPTGRGAAGRIHTSTVFRWARKGIGGIRLEVTKVGGTLCTSEAALQRFFDRLAGAEPATAPVPATRNSPDQAAVERALDALGVRARATGARMRRPQAGEHDGACNPAPKTT